MSPRARPAVWMLLVFAVVLGVGLGLAALGSRTAEAAGRFPASLVTHAGTSHIIHVRGRRPMGGIHRFRPVGQFGTRVRRAERKRDERPPRVTPRPRPRPDTNKDDDDDNDDDDRPRPRPRPALADRPPPRPLPVACTGGRAIAGICRCPIGAIRSGDRCVPVVRIWPIGPRPAVVQAVPAPRLPRAVPPGTTGGSSAPPPPSAATAEADANGEARTDEVLVVVALRASDAETDAVAARLNLQVIDRWPIPLIGKRCIRFRIPDGRDVETVLAALRREPSVAEPQPNYIYRAQRSPSRAAGATGAQYALAKVGLAAERTDVASGRGVVVGMVDTAVDTAHADLVASDIRVFDAAGRSRPAPPDAHGTAIAGIIAARGTTRGVAPGVRLAAAKAFTPGTAGGVGESTTLLLLKSLDWLMAQRVQVLNLSFAGPPDPLIRQAIDALTADGVIVVAAAGNNGRRAPPAYPAAYPDVIAVTATDADDRLYEKANVGPYVDIAAPGVDIFAATPGQAHELQSGTSFAAAHISGIIALLLEQQPGLTAARAYAALAEGALDLGPPGPDEAFGAGLADAPAALRLVTASARR